MQQFVIKEAEYGYIESFTLCTYRDQDLKSQINKNIHIP